jgi:uncharacterized membrane protein
MTLLIAGLLVWSLVHLTPTLASPLKQNLVDRFGQKGYKLIFTALILLSIALMVFGWRSIEPTFLYMLPYSLKHAFMLLIFIAFILMGASNYPTRIKSVIRHPQLTGVAIWALAHLLLNGDSRSVVLFGGLGIWAVLEIILINRREGAWVKPASAGWAREVRGLAISIVVFVVFAVAHPYFAGVSLH